MRRTHGRDRICHRHHGQAAIHRATPRDVGSDGARRAPLSLDSPTGPGRAIRLARRRFRGSRHFSAHRRMRVRAGAQCRTCTGNVSDSEQLAGVFDGWCGGLFCGGRRSMPRIVAFGIGPDTQIEIDLPGGPGSASAAVTDRSETDSNADTESADSTGAAPIDCAAVAGPRSILRWVCLCARFLIEARGVTA